MSWFRELPPTAGLPLSISDFIGNSKESTLEEKLASWLDVPFLQVEASGTAALVIALHSLKQLSPRKTVIVSAYTCPLVALAVQAAGLRLKVCDVSLASGVIDFDFDQLDSLCTPDTLCILSAHIAGLPSDAAKAQATAKRCGAFLIEDAAQSLGARRSGRFVGTTGDIGIFSLSRGKGLTIYDGGFIVTKDSTVRQAILTARRKLLEPYSASHELSELLGMIGHWFFYNPFGIRALSSTDMISGFDTCTEIDVESARIRSKLSVHSPGEFRKRIAARCMNRLPQALEENWLRAQSRLQNLRRIENIQVLSEANHDQQGTWSLLFLVMPTPTAAEQVLEYFSQSGLGISQLYPFALPDYRHLNYPVPPTHAPEAMHLAARSLTITNSSMLKESEFVDIAEAIDRFASNHVSTVGE